MITKTWGLRPFGATRAFTIIEALIAIVLVVSAVLGLVAIVPATIGGTMRDSQRMQAVDVGQQYLDRIRQYAATNGKISSLPAAPTVTVDAGLSNQDSTVLAASPGVFTITPNCSAAPNAVSGLEWDCVVTVTWTEASENRSVSVESYIVSQK
jgi:Tfp pilus assembly protein PilV